MLNNFYNKMSNISLNHAFTALFTFLLIYAIFNNFIFANWFNLFLSVLTLFLIYLPLLITKHFEIYIPPKFQLALVLFIYASLYLGAVKNFYIDIFWWDKVIHTFSGIILGIIGFILLYYLNQQEDIKLVMSPIAIALFSFTFAVTLGALWEIYEYIMSTYFGFNMQPFGLTDTIWDLIVDSIGALIASLSGYIYLTNEEPNLFYNLINNLKKPN